MKRVLLPLVVTAGLLAVTLPAWASDGGLERALGAYKSRLTSDIAYLAGFSAPSRGGAGSVLGRLSSISRDLAGAINAASGQRPSTHNGSRGRSLVLSGLNDALGAVGEARASGNAARSGNGAAARNDARSEQGEINRAIPLFEQGGHLLHLF